MVPFIWGTWNSQIHVDRKQKGVGQGQGGQGNKEVLFNRASLWEDRGFPDSSVGKEYTCNAGNPSLIPGLGRSSGKGTHYPLQYSWASLCGSAGKESTHNAGDLGSIPGSGRSPGEGNGYPLQYSGLENSKDYTVHGLANSRTQLSNFHFLFFHFLKFLLNLFCFMFWFFGSEACEILGSCAVFSCSFVSDSLWPHGL